MDKHFNSIKRVLYLSTAFLDSLVPFAHFMAELCTLDAEIILYDLIAGRIHYVENPLDETTVVGSRLRTLEHDLISAHSYNDGVYLINSRIHTHSDGYLRCSGLCLRDPHDPSEQPSAVLLINQRLNRFMELRCVLDSIIGNQTPKPCLSKEEPALFDISIPNIVIQAIEQELEALGQPVGRLNAQEKAQLVSRLDDKGVFLVKGAVTELAKRLGTTDTTVYRYVNRISAEKKRRKAEAETEADVKDAKATYTVKATKLD